MFKVINKIRNLNHYKITEHHETDKYEKDPNRTCRKILSLKFKIQ